MKNENAKSASKNVLETLFNSKMCNHAEMLWIFNQLMFLMFKCYATDKTIMQSVNK